MSVVSYVIVVGILDVVHCPDFMGLSLNTGSMFPGVDKTLVKSFEASVILSMTLETPRPIVPSKSTSINLTNPADSRTRGVGVRVSASLRRVAAPYGDAL